MKELKSALRELFNEEVVDIPENEVKKECYGKMKHKSKI